MKKSTKSTTLTKNSAQQHLHTRPTGGVMSPELPPQKRGRPKGSERRGRGQHEALSQTVIQDLLSERLEDLLPALLADAQAVEKRERARILKTLSSLQGGRS